MRGTIKIWPFISLVLVLSLYCHKLIVKIEETEGKKYLMIDVYVLSKVLNKIKEIRKIEKFVDTKILIHTNYQMVLL